MLGIAIVLEGWSLRTAHREATPSRAGAVVVDVHPHHQEPRAPGRAARGHRRARRPDVRARRHQPGRDHRQPAVGRAGQHRHRSAARRDRGRAGDRDEEPAHRRSGRARRSTTRSAPRSSTAPRCRASSTCARSTSAPTTCCSPPSSSSRARHPPRSLADAIDTVEARVRTSTPIVRLIFFEPDLYDAAARPTDEEATDEPARPTDTVAAVDRFNDAFNRHDVDAVMAAMTDDCVFENTSPPNGQRYEGQEQVRAAWEEFFAASPDAHFDGEDVIVAGDRCIVQWRYTWTNDDGTDELAPRRRRAARARRQGRGEVRVREGLTRSVSRCDAARAGSAHRCSTYSRRVAQRVGGVDRVGSDLRRARRAPSRRPARPSRSARPRPRRPARPASITARCSTIEPVPIERAVVHGAALEVREVTDDDVVADDRRA